METTVLWCHTCGTKWTVPIDWCNEDAVREAITAHIALGKNPVCNSEDVDIVL